MDDEKAKAWSRLEALGISEQTIKIVVAINGYTMETLRDILYAATGYHDFDQVP